MQSQSALVRRRLELLVVTWSALAFGALLASYFAFRPIRDAIVLDGKPDQLPWLFTATFVVFLIVSPLWSALLARAGRRRCVTLAFHVFVVCALGFAALVAADVAPITVGRVFYVWSAVFNLFVVSVFWSLLADLLGPATARRLYGPIAAGGTIGAIVGPLLTRALVDTVDVEGVLVMSAILLELSAIAVHQVRRLGDQLAPDPTAEQPSPGEAFAGIEKVLRDRYMLAIVAYVLCTATAATFMYLEQQRLVYAYLPDRVERTELLATIELWTNLGTFAVQGLLAAPLLARLGPGLVMIALPLAQAAGISLLAFVPSLAILIAVQATTRALTHGLTRPARELLFTVLPTDDKYRAKNAIDTVGYRFGDFSSAWLHRLLVSLGTGSLALAAAMIPLAAAWIALALVLGAGFKRRLHQAPP
jgi:AAA family ATP:ADP antiporter